MADASADTGDRTQLGIHFSLGVVGDLSDAHFLRRFLDAGGDDAREAFSALARRHGPMVLRVCLDVLGDPHEAQDAFQATFLVFARRAASVRDGDALASWLHGVALRVSRRALSNAARRARAECLGAASRASGRRPDGGPPEDWSEIHDEVDRLPRRYREPVVLCYLEGLTADAAARRIGCPRGTVLSRLARARSKLRDRLIRRGLAPAFALFAAGLTPRAEAAVSTSLVDATALASWLFASRDAAPALTASTMLAKGVLYAMTSSKLKAVGVVALTCMLAAGAAKAPGVRPAVVVAVPGAAQAGVAPHPAEGRRRDEKPVEVRIAQRYLSATLPWRRGKSRTFAIPDQFERNRGRGFLRPGHSLDYALKVRNTTDRPLRLLVSHGLEGEPLHADAITVDAGMSRDVHGTVSAADLPDDPEVARDLKVRVAEGDASGRRMADELVVPFRKVAPGPVDFAASSAFRDGILTLEVTHSKEDRVTAPGRVGIKIEPYTAIRQVDREPETLPLGEKARYVYAVDGGTTAVKWTLYVDEVKASEGSLRIPPK